MQRFGKENIRFSIVCPMLVQTGLVSRIIDRVTYKSRLGNSTLSHKMLTQRWPNVWPPLCQGLVLGAVLYNERSLKRWISRSDKHDKCGSDYLSDTFLDLQIYNKPTGLNRYPVDHEHFSF